MWATEKELDMSNAMFDFKLASYALDRRSLGHCVESSDCKDEGR